MAFSILSGNSGKTCFPSFFALALSAGGYPKQKRQEKNDDDYIHSSFNSRIAAKHPVKHFVIIKRGGVVTGPQTVPKVYVGHVFLVPINYISLGMVRATGFFVQLRYVANNSVLCFSDMRFSDTQQARICRKKPESDIYQNYADFVLLRHPCFFCCLRLAISPDVNIFKSPAAPGAFKEKNSCNSKCLLPPAKLATSFVWCMKRICK